MNTSRRHSSDLLLQNLHSQDPQASARKLAAKLRKLRFDSKGSLEERFSFKMESATKWDFRSPRTYKSMEATENHVEEEPQIVSAASYLHGELWRAQIRIRELENDKILSEERIKRLIRRKPERERREHDEHPLIDYLQHKLSDERKQRRRAEAVNARLQKKVSESQSLLRRREKEREAMEEVCEELVRRMEALRAKTNRIRDEMEEEREMLQMAEVWREERVKMKLEDAKLALQEKYELMNQIVSEFEKFLKVKKDEIGETNMRRAQGLMKMARSVNVSYQIEFEHSDSLSENSFCND